ncbi:MAG TPA: type I glyceraldehyde-3-phosphate dehydrogenase [Hellea balneolensis]|uniref:Glyceraldehyde-3-phosphate dehydrogenase n=1 Tax=Hellea balneolensis TaxID=287478 RepID=A0A7V5U173_9PROT|nr:type I glyceraldehyde-3-phosphate dehydrogenase [Hellea balneolensis]
MTMRIGINGFGRIGRLVVRAVVEYGMDDIEIVAINSPGKLETMAHLLRYDTMHGRFGGEVKTEPGMMDFGRGKVRITHERNPADVDWKSLDLDLVMECSGHFRDRPGNQLHLDGGANKVLVSAPAKGVDKTIVYGVNEEDLTKEDLIVSCASCTTNCLAPLAKVLMEAVGIRRGFMTTIHSYTLDQRILDSSHKDMYRARAAAQNMIPTSTGAAKAVGLVLPELDGKLHGSAIRVPTANVSLVDLAFQPERVTNPQELNDFVRAAAEGPLKGVIRYTEEPLVSSDINHDPHSNVFAAPLTEVLHHDLVKVISWYDNEWGFANRMIDVARTMKAAQ